MSILRFLGFGNDVEARAPRDEVDTIRRIARELDQLEPDRARFLAAFAFILSRVARADMDVSDDETRAMERIVAERGELPERQAVLVVQMAKTQSLLFGGTEHFVVTKEFQRQADRGQRLALLRCLFEVSAADESVSTAESHVIRQIADELNLPHRDYAAVRGEFRDKLAVLRKPGADPTEPPAGS